MAALKHSKQRESIKELLMSRKDHPTADMVYTDIRKEYPNISLGTVYRNLSLLSEIGEIKKLVTGEGADHYDADTSPHNHFICKCCGSVLDLDMEDVGFIMEKAGENFAGMIDSYSVNFYGTCEKCMNTVLS